MPTADTNTVFNSRNPKLRQGVQTWGMLTYNNTPIGQKNLYLATLVPPPLFINKEPLRLLANMRWTFVITIHLHPVKFNLDHIKNK